MVKEGIEANGKKIKEKRAYGHGRAPKPYVRKGRKYRSQEWIGGRNNDVVEYLKERYMERGDDFIFKAKQVRSHIGSRYSICELSATLRALREYGLVSKEPDGRFWKTHFSKEEETHQMNRSDV